MNKVILIGNLARDPELRTTQSGIAMCRFTVACSRRVPNAQGVREADFISVIAWREKAEFVSRYFTKGRKIAVEGSIQVRSYDGPDGAKRYSTEVVADNVEFVDSQRGEGANAGSGSYQSAPSEGNSSSGGYAPSGDKAPAKDHAPVDDFMQVDDDELPF